MAEERWRPVPGHRGYEASSEARTRSVPRTLSDGRAAGGVVLQPVLDKDGYGRVKFGRKLVAVHVAVALAFLGPPEVRHLDGDESNSRPENLAWGSRRDNERDKREQKRRRKEKEEEEREVGRKEVFRSRPFNVETFRTSDLPQ